MQSASHTCVLIEASMVDAISVICVRANRGKYGGCNQRALKYPKVRVKGGMRHPSF